MQFKPVEIDYTIMMLHILICFMYQIMYKKKKKKY
jgi:hypothetical protein